MTIARKPSKVREVPTKGLAKGAGSSRHFRKPKLDSTASVIIATVEPKFQNGIGHKRFRGGAELTKPAKFIPFRGKKPSLTCPSNVPFPSAKVGEGFQGLPNPDRNLTDGSDGLGITSFDVVELARELILVVVNRTTKPIGTLSLNGIQRVDNECEKATTFLARKWVRRAVGVSEVGHHGRNAPRPKLGCK